MSTLLGSGAYSDLQNAVREGEGERGRGGMERGTRRENE